MPISVEPVHVETAVQDVLAMVGDAAHLAQVELVPPLIEMVPPVMADRVRLRQVLVNYAEHRRAAKAGGGVVHVQLEDDTPLVADNAINELLDLDKALRALETESPRRGRIVECRLFGGLSVEETAAALEISPATVKREWQVASALLFRHIGGEH